MRTRGPLDLIEAMSAQPESGLADCFSQHGADEDTLLPPEVPPARRLNEVTTPSLYIIGELDIEEKHALADLFTAGIPGARKIMMAGCDHVPFMEKPEEFNQIVLHFLEENSSTAQ